MSNISTDLKDVEKIIVLDYGSQYNQLISRRIREIGVFSELKSHKISAAEVREINPVGIILSGGPNSVYEDGSFDIDPEIFELGIPILGICYGMQLLTHKLGGKLSLQVMLEIVNTVNQLLHTHHQLFLNQHQTSRLF